MPSSVSDKSSCLPNCSVLERGLRNLLGRHARFVALHPLPFVLIPIAITLACVPGIFIRNENNDFVYLYTPTNAKSLYEAEVIRSHWPNIHSGYNPARTVSVDGQCQVTVVPRNESRSILEAKLSRTVTQLNFYISKIAVFAGGRKFSYADLCMKDIYGECYLNEIVIGFAALYDALPEEATYPFFIHEDVQHYVASSIGGVVLDPIKPNYIDSARGWLLIYHVRYDEKYRELSQRWELEFEAALRNFYDEEVDVTFFHSQSLVKEVGYNGQVIIEKYTLSIALLLGFVVLCSFQCMYFSLLFLTGRWYPDWTRSNPVLATHGILTAGFAGLTTVGFLSYCGAEINMIVVVVPFLITGIGVDNMFLLNAAWSRSDPSAPVADRLEQSLKEIAVSVTITSVTDALSFAVAASTHIPAVQMFAYYTCIAIIFTFVYQLTYYLGLLALYGRLERAGRHSVTFLRTIDYSPDKKYGLITRLFMLGTHHGDSQQLTSDKVAAGQSLPISQRFFKEIYAPFLTHTYTKIITVTIYLVYIAFSIYGCFLISTGLEPSNLVLEDSYIIRHYNVLQNYFWPLGPDVQIVVNNPPDFRQKNAVKEAWNIVDAFTNTRFTMGNEGLNFWLQNYERLIESEADLKEEIDSNYTLFVERLRTNFLNSINTAIYLTDVKFDDNDPLNMTAYRFTLGMKNIANTTDQQVTQTMLREIADSLPQYNITTFFYLWYFVDQYHYVLPTTLQNIAIALLCMAVVSILLIPKPVVVLCIILSIISIDLGVIGFMAVWGLKLDVITMVTLIMSIGFSVDFTAHVAYHFSVSTEPSANQRVQHSVALVGWPIVQGALSTLICVIPMTFIPAYVVAAVWKCVTLVIIFGGLHGLVFVPVILPLLYELKCQQR